MKRIVLIVAVAAMSLAAMAQQSAPHPTLTEAAAHNRHSPSPVPEADAQHAPHPGSSDEMGGMEHGASSVAWFASGTSWLPTSSPRHMWMEQAGGWSVMAHGNLLVGYNQQTGPLGVGKLESQNWLMLMEQHRLGAGSITLRQMFSAEPLTAPHGGYPQLFQTGETYRARALVNAQHPHDVFSELAAIITYPVGERVSWLFYGGPVGEPALGPVGFPHRISAQDNPAAPLGHHLQDSTHISFGVVTTGVMAGPLKLEASAFNGREPDERRWDFDMGALDSWSARIGYAPGRNWAMQYSFGHLVHPEALEDTNIDRHTASIAYNRPLTNGYWSTSLIWGRNHKLAEGTAQNSYMLESVVNFRRMNYAFTRLELVDRDELFPESHDHQAYRVGGYTLGGMRDLVQGRAGQLGLGASVTFFSKPSALDAAYGRNPVGVHVFLRFRPSAR